VRMTRFVVSFDEGAMTFPDEDLPAVSAATHAVVRDAQAAGVWVTGGGFPYGDQRSLVSPDGTVQREIPEAPGARVGGFCILELPTLDDALDWAARMAVSCRCTQEVRAFMDDPDV
jgi:hypothetical protein